MEVSHIQRPHSFFEKILLIGSKDEKTFIIENLSLMLSAGLSIPRALESIVKGLRNKKLILIVRKVIKDMDEGSTLHAALGEAGLLPPYALSLIKIGEESGRLAQNLEVVSLQQQKEEALNSKLRSAMIYPVLVLSITVLVGLGVAWFILPRLAKVFVNLKLKLPLITHILISFANLLSRKGYWLIPLFVCSLCTAIYVVFYNRHTNWLGQSILFALPVTGKLVINLELSRFGYVMSGLLSAGIPIEESVRLLSESSQVYRYQKFYQYLEKGFGAGNSFKTTFEQYPKVDRLIPPSIQEVIIAGEQSGKLSQSLTLVANRFEQKSEESIKNLPVVLEPVFLVVVWLGVLVVALAVILPIYSLVGNLNNSAAPSAIKK